MYQATDRVNGEDFTQWLEDRTVKSYELEEIEEMEEVIFQELSEGNYDLL